MKIKFEVARGDAVISYSKKDVSSMGEIIDLLLRDEVIKISVIKKTSAQYLRERMNAKNEIS